MNTTPPRTNSAPSQMTSILASAGLYPPKPLARQQYHHFPGPRRDATGLALVLSAQQQRQLGDVCRYAPGFVTCE